ncbi:MAG: hypothetical protein ACRDRA_06175 [Pseudonocardiaceae bacterium]
MLAQTPQTLDRDGIVHPVLPPHVDYSLTELGTDAASRVLFNVYPERLPEDDSAPLPACAGVSRQGSTAPCKGVP